MHPYSLSIGAKVACMHPYSLCLQTRDHTVLYFAFISEKKATLPK
jgi:hypothetical protein